MSDEFDTSRYSGRRTGATPSVDGNRPRIQRTNSLLFGYNSPAPTNTVNRRGAGGTFGSNVTPTSSERTAPAAQGGTELPSWYTQFFGGPDPLGLNAGGVTGEGQRRGGGGSFADDESTPYNEALSNAIERDSVTTVNSPDANDPANQSIFSPLGDLNPDATFLFDRGSVLSLDKNGEPIRTGVANSRGVYGSADSLERQLEPGKTTETGNNDNLVTIAAGVQWLRNLAARDRAAYNQLVVLLRNAGYPGLSANDAELPLNGYSQQVGSAFALAANDLSAANAGGDNRTLMEYLTDRGKGYADYLAQQAADQAAADAYQPVERQYTDPDTLLARAREAAVSAIGRKLTDEEEARLAASFRSQENAFYDQLDTAREGKTKFAAAAPDVTGQVDSFIEGDQFDQERGTERVRQYGEALFQLLSQ